MAITVADVRLRCSDAPYPQPEPQDAPEVIGIGDGTTTTFQTQKTPYTGSALLVGQGITIWFNSGAGWVQQQSGWTFQNGYQVVFSAAPASSTIVGARYYYTTFSDSDLQSVLTLSQGDVICTTDQITLMMCEYIVVGMLLKNKRLLMSMIRGDSHDDPIVYADGLKEIRADLGILLYGKERPGSNVPSLSIAQIFKSPYQPRN